VNDTVLHCKSNPFALVGTTTVGAPGDPTKKCRDWQPFIGPAEHKRTHVFEKKKKFDVLVRVVLSRS